MLSFFLIEASPLLVAILHRTPFETGQFHAKLHPVGVARQGEVDVLEVGPHLRLPVAGIVREQDFDRIILRAFMRFGQVTVLGEATRAPVLDADQADFGPVHADGAVFVHHQVPAHFLVSGGEVFEVFALSGGVLKGLVVAVVVVAEDGMDAQWGFHFAKN